MRAWEIYEFDYLTTVVNSVEGSTMRDSVRVALPMIVTGYVQ